MTACCQIAGCSLFYGKTDISQAGIYSNAANSCLVCIGIACMLYPSVYACALVSIVLRCQKGMPGLFPVLFCDAEQALPQAHTGFPVWRESLFREAGFPLSDAFPRISLISRMLCICAEIRVYRSEIYVVRIYAVLSEFTVCGMSLFLHYNACCKKNTDNKAGAL